MIQRYVLLIVALLITGIAQAQSDEGASYPFKGDLEKGNYEKAESRILKRLSKDSTDMECYYAAFQLYALPGFPGHDEERAYYCLIRTYKLYIHADPKLLDRATRDGYNGSLFDADLRSVCRQGMATARRRHSVDGYQHFLDYFAQAPDDQRDSMAACRDTLELANASLGATVAALQEFIDRRPQSTVRTDAIRRRDSIAFASADSIHSIAAYEQFRTTYPQSHLYARATDSIHTIDFRAVRRQDTELYYRSYAERYPESRLADSARHYADSIEYHRLTDGGDWQQLMAYYDEHPDRPHWSRHALDAWCDASLRRQMPESATLLLKRLPADDSSRAPLAAMLHHAFLNTSVNNYERFYAEYPGLMPDSVRQHDSAAWAMNARYNYYNGDSCIRAIAPYHEALVMLQQLLKDDIDHGRWAEARERVLLYQDCFGDDYGYRKLLAAIETEAEPNIKTTPLSSVNTAKGDEYAPLVSADGKTLYFAGKKRPDNLGGTDIYTAHSAGSWSKGSLVMDLSHSYANEVPTGLSADGNSIVMIQGNSIVCADRKANGWNKAEAMSIPVSDTGWKSDATLATNGRVLFFAAYGRTEREVKASQNIYVTVMDDSGRWSQPKEIGAAVNTPFDERSPLLHADMQTLYFSSEGHGSLGQRDMFVCHRLSDTSWTEWSEPENIGKEINGTDDDWGFSIDAEGKRAYFSRRTTSQDIYSVTLPLRSRPQPVTLVTGTVKNGAGKKIGTQLRWYDAESNTLLGQCQSHPAKGTYTIALPQGRRYSIAVYDELYKPQPETIDLTGESRPSVIKNDIFVVFSEE